MNQSNNVQQHKFYYTTIPRWLRKVQSLILQIFHCSGNQIQAMSWVELKKALAIYRGEYWGLWVSSSQGRLLELNQGTNHMVTPALSVEVLLVY